MRKTIRMDKGKVYEKSFFGKWKQLTTEQYVHMVDNANTIKLKLQYFNTLIYYLDKIVVDNKAKVGHFGTRVDVVIDNFGSTMKKRSDGLYAGNIVFEGKFVDATKGKKLTSRFALRMPQLVTPYNIGKTTIEALMQNAYSGIYRTPWDYELLTRELENAGAKRQSEFNYVCDTCREKFVMIEDFFEHLKETHHPDGIITSFPYCEEVQEVFKKIE